jgi:hypothetical protein
MSLPEAHETVANRRNLLDVADPATMKEGLDAVSLPNFVTAAGGPSSARAPFSRTSRTSAGST